MRSTGILTVPRVAKSKTRVGRPCYVARPSWPWADAGGQDTGSPSRVTSMAIPRRVTELGIFAT